MFEEIKKLIEQNRIIDGVKLMRELNEVDIVEILHSLEQDKMLKIFRLLPKEVAANAFAYMDKDEQQYIVESITGTEISCIMDELFMDDTVDFIEEMPANVVKKVLQEVSSEKRSEINQLLKYPENSAGSIMTTEFVDLKKEMTVKEAIQHIKKTGTDKETIDNCFVISPSRRLEGLITIRKLILSKPEEIVADIMETSVISANTLDDQETVAREFKLYDFITMPVVDNEGRLVGIITIDDVIEVIEQEETEDFHKMAAMEPTETPYLKTSAFVLAKKRVVWLLILMVSATITSAIIAHFQTKLSALIVLTAYIPVIMDTGGNAGAQSSTMIIRSLALNQVEFRDIFKIIWKEFRVAIIAGTALAVVNFARIMLFDDGVSVAVAAVVSITMLCVVILAKFFGGILPILAQKIHLDPVIMAGPLITTIVDAMSLTLYFAIATPLISMV